MANLIRLKQIESASAIQTAAVVGADFSASVNEVVSQSIETQFSQSIITIITNNVGAVLPDGVVSSSAQIELVSASGYEQLATDIEVSVVSSSVAASINILSNTYVTTASLNIVSASLDGRVTSLENFSTSLDLTYATDAELAISQSNINVDMGEW
jgi:hypothetical protein